MTVITKGRVFGDVKCFMYSIEWQKPWLKDKLQPVQFDVIISAEIPDPNNDKALYDIVMKNMIHGPCGVENPLCPYMKDRKCTKKFSRNLLKETLHTENGYPMYRRRAPKDGGRMASVKLRNGSQVSIGNSWVVAYSPVLLKTFKAHINVEACGSDQAIFNFRSSEAQFTSYTSNASRKCWKHRIQGTAVLNWPGLKSGDTVGRVYTVHVSNIECFCLRLLQHHVRGPTSFNDLKNCNG